MDGGGGGHEGEACQEMLDVHRWWDNRLNQGMVQHCQEGSCGELMHTARIAASGQEGGMS
jgi:hypothetical protein